MRDLSRLLAGYGLVSGAMGLMTLALLPDWWLSSLVLLALACVLIALSIAVEEWE